MRSWIDPGCDPSRRASRRNASRRSASRRSGARFATPAAAPNVASGGCRNCWKLKLRHAQRSINDAMQEVHWRRPMSSHLSRIAATSAERMDGPGVVTSKTRCAKRLRLMRAWTRSAITSSRSSIQQRLRHVTRHNRYSARNPVIPNITD